MIDEESKQRFHRFTQKGLGCWLWISTLDPCGHGKMWVGKYGDRKMRLAKDVSWVIHNGPIPENHTIHHICDNASCVNPEHLKLYAGRAKGKYTGAEKYARRRAKQLEESAKQEAEINAWNLLLCKPWRKYVQRGQQTCAGKEMRLQPESPRQA